MTGAIIYHAVDGMWFNIPERVTIVGWMPVPDTTHLPVAEHYTDQSSQPKKLLGCIATADPAIYECVFEGDYSEAHPKDLNR